MPSYSRSVKIPGKKSHELYETVSKDIDRFVEKASLGKFEIERNPDTKEVKVKSSMATATLVCTDETLTLQAELSWMAAPFRGKLDEGINRWISKTFNITV